MGLEAAMVDESQVKAGDVAVALPGENSDPSAGPRCDRSRWREASVSDTLSEEALSVDEAGDAVVVTVRPALVTAPWARVEQAGTRVVEKIESRTAPRCAIDLSPLTYIGSAQVALLLRIWKAVQKGKGECVIACPHPVVLDVIALAGLTKIWTIRPTREIALAELGVLPERKKSAENWTAAAAVLSIIAAGAAMAGAVVVWRQVPEAMEAGRWLQYGGAAVAVAAGLACLIAAAGWRRWAGAVAAATAIAAASFGMGRMSAESPPAPASTSATVHINSPLPPTATISDGRSSLSDAC
jgi:anti-anti-sigma factor